MTNTPRLSELTDSIINVGGISRFAPIPQEIAMMYG